MAEGQVEEQVALRRLIFLATVISGLVAAYLMYRRGESVISIARRTAGRMQGDDRRSGAADAGEMQLAGQPREAQLLPPHRLPRRAHLSATAAESR